MNHAFAIICKKKNLYAVLFFNLSFLEFLEFLDAFVNVFISFGMFLAIIFSYFASVSFYLTSSDYQFIYVLYCLCMTWMLWSHFFPFLCVTFFFFLFPVLFHGIMLDSDSVLNFSHFIFHFQNVHSILFLCFKSLMRLS